MIRADFISEVGIQVLFFNRPGADAINISGLLV